MADDQIAFEILFDLQAVPMIDKQSPQRSQKKVHLKAIDCFDIKEVWMYQ